MQTATSIARTSCVTTAAVLVASGIYCEPLSLNGGATVAYHYRSSRTASVLISETMRGALPVSLGKLYSACSELEEAARVMLDRQRAIADARAARRAEYWAKIATLSSALSGDRVAYSFAVGEGWPRS